MEWIKKHADTVVVLGAVLGAMMWMNGTLNDVQKEIYTVQKELSIVKTVMLMNGHYPKELACKDVK